MQRLIFTHIELPEATTTLKGPRGPLQSAG